MACLNVHPPHCADVLLTDCEHPLLLAEVLLPVDVDLPVAGLGLELPPEPPPQPISMSVKKIILRITEKPSAYLTIGAVCWTH